MKHGISPANSNFYSPSIFGLRLLTALFFLNLFGCSRTADNLSPATVSPPTVSPTTAAQAQSRAALSPASAINVLTGEVTDDNTANNSALDGSSSGCRSNQPLGASLAEIARNAHHTEELNDESAAFSDTFLDWIFGGGLGRTAVNIGTVIVFPPYAIYMFGNAGIALAGYDPLYVTDALPEKARTGVLSAYDEVTSLPGRMNAAVMRQKFCGSAHPQPSAIKNSADPLKPVAVEER